MSALNANHQRAILHAFLDIHRRLVEVETVLDHAQDESPFVRFDNDLSPAEVQALRDDFAGIRAAMVTCLKEAGIPIDVSRTSLRWFVQGQLTFASVALEEIGPKQLKGYGPLDEAGRAEVVQLRDDIGRLIERVSKSLRQGASRVAARGGIRYQ